MKNNFYQVILFHAPSDHKLSRVICANSSQEAINKVFDSFIDDTFYSLVECNLISDRSEIDSSLLPG